MRTEYRGPTAVGTIRAGSATIRLVRPAEPDRLLDDGDVHRLNHEDDYMPYWAYLWPGAYLLAEGGGRGARGSGRWRLGAGSGWRAWSACRGGCRSGSRTTTTPRLRSSSGVLRRTASI